MSNYLSKIKMAGEKHPLITGSFLLTLAGFISRLIGFFYRMFLSRQFGEEGMGIYQLIGPVMALAFSLSAAGFQTSISKFVAEYTGKHQGNSKQIKDYQPFLLGLSISLPLSVLIMLFVQTNSAWIAGTFLQEPRTAPLLRILALSLPLSAAHACINGYFYGKKQAVIPAICQLAEQFARVLSVYFLCQNMLIKGQTPSLSITVTGILIGEMVSVILSLFALLYTTRTGPERRPNHIANVSTEQGITYPILLGMAIPLIANRITINLLQSIETVSLPAKLRLYGYDTSTALSVYGVLTGMAFPLLFFPNALTSAIAVMLLPLISERSAQGDKGGVQKLTIKTIRYSSLLGFSCLLVFLIFGEKLGLLLFHSPLAGLFIRALSFMCPFLYLNGTLSAILQGLGKVIPLFFINVTALLVRLAFILSLVPAFGIRAYLWGLLAGQILQSTCYLFLLNHASNKKTLF